MVKETVAKISKETGVSLGLVLAILVPLIAITLGWGDLKSTVQQVETNRQRDVLSIEDSIVLSQEIVEHEISDVSDKIDAIINTRWSKSDDEEHMEDFAAENDLKNVSHERIDD